MINKDLWRSFTEAQKISAINYIDIPAEIKADILDNLELFDRFIKEAHKLVERGRYHYSARTIIEWLRHNSTMSDSDEVFKINNNIVPKLARASMLLFPELNGLFNIRESV